MKKQEEVQKFGLNRNHSNSHKKAKDPHNVGQSEVLLNMPDKDYNRQLPVTLTHYENDTYDLHAQTGEYHKEAIEISNKLLSWRGLKVGKAILLGPSGMYYTVEKL